MNNETRASESVTSGSRGPSRRTLVRSAAWSVPVISAAAAAPAFAASGVLNFSPAPSATKSGEKKLTLGLSVLNTSTTDATGNLQVTVQFPATYVNPTLQGTLAAGWGLSPNGNQFVFTATAGNQAGIGGTRTLTFEIRVKSNVGAATVLASATSTGFTGANASISAPAL